MMRQLLLVLTLIGALPFARAADHSPLTTNTIVIAQHGTLEALTPPDWTLIQTNMNLPGNPSTVELHSVSNTIVLRLTIFWDGFAGRPVKPTEDEMEQTVSDTVVQQYLPGAVEKSLKVEKLHGPNVTGCFVRFTDANWIPMQQNGYRNLATGMFRCGNLWGNFDLVMNDKDGPLFKAGLKVAESLRRKP